MHTHPTQKCAYCETDFVPRVRFKQKYCSKSCKVLYSRHKGSRKEYEASKINALPTAEVMLLLKTFINEFAGEYHTPMSLQRSPFVGKIEATLAHNLPTQERNWLVEIQQTLLEVSQFTPQKKPFQIVINPKILKDIEQYVGNAY